MLEVIDAVALNAVAWFAIVAWMDHKLGGSK